MTTTTRGRPDDSLPPGLSAMIQRCRHLAGQHGPDAVLGAVTGAVARHHDVRRQSSGGSTTDAPSEQAAAAMGLIDAVALPEGLARPEALGWVREGLLEPGERRRSGAFYTPPEVAAGLCARALDGLDPVTVTVCDPAVGGGAFLLAAARWLHANGVAPHDALGRLWGADTDELAVRTARDSLQLWVTLATREGGVTGPIDPAVCRHRIVRGDPLTAGKALWPGAPPEGFTVVVGNPPFQGQLRSTTVRSRNRAGALRDALPGMVGPYVDTAALFWAAAQGMVEAERGRVALIVPESLLTTRDGQPARRGLGESFVLRHLWVAGSAVFGAQVRVCAPVFDADPAAARRALTRSTGVDFSPVADLTRSAVPTAHGSWGRLLAGLQGVPLVHLDATATLGDVAEATAGFRDQYYGIAGHVVDDPHGYLGAGTHLKLVTSGLIDVLWCGWGERPVTYRRRRWAAPRVDRAALRSDDPALAGWADRLAVPKLVVATQTRVLEAAIDIDADWYPLTPTVAVIPTGVTLSHVAALLCAPAASAWLHGEAAGSGLSPGHLRVAATRLRALPLPVDGAAWDEAAALLEQQRPSGSGSPRRHRELVLAVGEHMARAYRSAPDLTSWWRDQLPELRDDR